MAKISGQVRFVAFDQCYCDLSWGWLTDPETRRLTLTPEFTREQQETWFKNLQTLKDYKIWGIECSSKPIGAVGLKHIDFTEKKAEYFGYIGNKQFWSKGIGNSMMPFITQQARSLGLVELYLHVGRTNERAIRLYKKHGFIEATPSDKGNDDSIIYMICSL